jgi:hypothetical protein
MGQFFANVGGYTIGEIPEAGMSDLEVKDGQLLYVDDDAVADRMAAQTGLYRRVDQAEAVAVLKSGEQIAGWHGDISDLDQTPDKTQTKRTGKGTGTTA